MIIIYIFGKIPGCMVKHRKRYQKIHILVLAFAQIVLWSQGNYLILFSSLTYLSKYMNNTGLLD